MQPYTLDPAKRAVSAARTLCVCIFVGAAFSVVGWWNFPSFSQTVWLQLIFFPAAGLSYLLTWMVRRPSLRLSVLIIGVNVALTLGVSAINNFYAAMSGEKFECFLGFKLTAAAIALIAPSPPLLGYIVVAICGILPIVEYFVLFPPEARINIVAPAPWSVVVYAAVALFILFHRLRQSWLEQETFLRGIVEASEEGVWVIDRSRRATYVNPKLCRMLGYELAEIMGRDALDMIAVDSHEITLERLSRRRKGIHEQFELKLLRKDGDLIFTQMAASPVWDAYGNYQGAFAFVSDLTEQKNLQQQVMSRGELLEGILNHMSEGVFVVSPDRSVRAGNKSARRLMGLSEISKEDPRLKVEDMRLLMSIRDLEGNPLPPEALTSLQALQGKTVQPLTSLLRVPGTNQDLITQSNAALFRDPEGKGTGAVVVVRDVTDAVNLERMKDQFIRVAAHELKTPVTVVKLNTQTLPLLLNDSSPRVKQLLGSLGRGADRIDRIVRDLIDVCQLQVGGVWLSSARIDLASRIQSVCERFRGLTHGHRILTNLPSSQAWVEADGERIDQVLDNLLENAVKFSPEGGEIRVGLERSDDVAVVTVKDDGIGIPIEKQIHVFDRFYRARADTVHDYGGLGVGLYICKEIIRRHGGAIKFESVENEGSRFQFSLPLIREPEL